MREPTGGDVTVRKQEYVHLHALLVEVARYLVDRRDMPTAVLSEYESLGTRPSNVNESKRAHRDAVATLSAAIGTWLGTLDDEPDLTAP